VRFDITQATVTNPVFGLKMATSGDEIYCYQVDLCSNAVANSPVATTTGTISRGYRIGGVAGAELGTDFNLDAVVKEIGREQWLLGCPTCYAGLYVNAANQVVYRGVSLGADLGDTLNTAAAWTPSGTNTITTDGEEIKFTYVNNAQGGAISLNAVGGLTTNLTVGRTYLFSGTARVSTGSVNFFVNDGVSNLPIGAQTATSATAFSFRFRALSAAGCSTFVNAMTTGEIIWLGNLKLQEVKELTSTTSISSNTVTTIGVHNGTDGATLYINGSAEATNATMTTPVTWGTSVRVGGDTAATNPTAATVLNGSVSVISSANSAIAGTTV
jgi:hypothetical protein